jgi:UDP-N-acetylmuramoyl-tripeptide--D-alanyl-D-alanine ligase
MPVLARIDRKIDYAVKVIRRVILYPLAWINRRLHHETVFVGITGSAGKTTAKDMCAAILSEFGACESAYESANEHFGVAQTVWRSGRRHRFCVIELSASRPGYLDFSLSVAKPDIAVITLIARDHLSAFGSIEAIAREKGKVVAALPRNGVAVMNIDDPLVKAIGDASKVRVIWFGQSEGATLRRAPGNLA